MLTNLPNFCQIASFRNKQKDKIRIVKTNAGETSDEIKVTSHGYFCTKYNTYSTLECSILVAIYLFETPPENGFDLLRFPVKYASYQHVFLKTTNIQLKYVS